MSAVSRAGVKHESLDDLLMRLKTTTINSTKFAAVVQVIDQMIVGEDQEFIKWDQNRPRPVRELIMAPENYKFVLKGLAAKNKDILSVVLRLLFTIGSFEKYADLIEQMDTLATLAKHYRAAEDNSTKQTILYVSSELASGRPAIAKLQKMGFIQHIASDFIKCTRGEHLTHENLQY